MCISFLLFLSRLREGVKFYIAEDFSKIYFLFEEKTSKA